VIITVFDRLPYLDYQLLSLTLAAEKLKYPGPNCFILMACEPGTEARRNNMMPKLEMILIKIKE